jgi:hypothetical protein
MFSLSDIITKLHDGQSRNKKVDYFSELACFRKSVVVGVCNHR